MDVALAIAGLICLALALGHATLGLVWVLPGLTEDHLPRTPFGPASMTEGMLRVTWHIVTVFAVSLGTLLMVLAWAPSADPKTVVLRWFAAMWLAATAMAFWVAGRRMNSPRRFLRLPVPLLWVVVAVLCWVAST
jgi:hypothetical protein